MPYTAKTNWTPDDPVMETDINRWEQGIADAHALLAQYGTAISNLQNRMNVMESTLPENFTHNLFTEDLTSLSSIKLIRGRYNQAESRLEV